jgi:prolipoprotein diacylglyceryltransferase
MPPSAMLRNSEIANSYPGGIVPDNTPMHPTPVYEFIAALIIFYILWRNRKNNWIDGKLFMLYLILASVSRFTVEFIRLNPRILIGLSEAQLIAITLGTIGIIGFSRLNRKRNNVNIDSGSPKGMPSVKAE